MALTYRTIHMNCQLLRHITKPVKWSVQNHHPIRILASGMCYRRNIHRSLETCDPELLSRSIRQCSTKNTHVPPPEPPKKEGLIQKLKDMYKNYWYVAVPVHMATSAIWFGTFYYIVRSGVDVLALLESLGISEQLLSKLRNSGAGYFALTFALYKVASPLRYAVTVGVTTFAIKRLTAMGLIKPVPSKARIKEMIQEQKDTFQDRKQHYQVQIQEKRTLMMDEMRKYKQQMKDKVKKM